MMAPIEIDGRLLVDGGAVNNLPVNLVTEFDPDIIIAVNLGMGLKTKEEIKSFFSVLSQSLAFPQKKAVETHRALADVLIEPDIEKYGFADFDKIDEIIEVGYQAAKAKIPEIKRLIAENGKTLPEKRVSRFEHKEIKKISFSGNSVYSSKDLERLISNQTGEAFDLKKAKQDKKAIWRAYFSKGYKLVDVAGVFDPDTGMLIYEIDEGHVELVQIKGRENLSNVFLQSKIRGHSVFNMKAVHANIDRLYATGYFESVNFAVIPGVDGWTVEYKVKEKKRNSLSLGMRYDTYEQLSLLTDLKMKFFKSQNFSNILSLKIGNEFSARFISEFWPERFGNNLVGEATLFYDKRVQDIYNGSRVSSSFYYLPKGLKVAAKANVEPFGQLSSGVILTHVNYENIFSLFPDETITKAFVRTEIEALDNPISPKGGFSAGAEYQQSTLMLGGQYDFAKAIADASAYVSLPRSHVIFAKGYLQLGKGNLPLYERHRLGGAANLLGYGRTQYLGKHAATLRFGYRIPLFYSATGILEDVYLSLLQDFGVAAMNISDFSTANVTSGYGAELQADTILGLSSRLSIGIGQATYLYFAIGNEF
jgi:outer membrane protein assembly factor BamA